MFIPEFLGYLGTIIGNIIAIGSNFINSMGKMISSIQLASTCADFLVRAMNFIASIAASIFGVVFVALSGGLSAVTTFLGPAIIVVFSILGVVTGYMIMLPCCMLSVGMQLFSVVAPRVGGILSSVGGALAGAATTLMGVVL